MSLSEMKQHKVDLLMQEHGTLQRRLDDARDENVTLKLKVADLEQELLDERLTNKSRTDSTVDALKAQVQSNYFDSKLRFDEELMTQKETIYKLKIELAGAEERNQVLRDQMVESRKRIIQLENDNVRAAKEAYILNAELDQEAQRYNQLEAKA